MSRPYHLPGPIVVRRRIAVEPEGGWVKASFAYALSGWNPWTMRGFTSCRPPLIRSRWIGGVKFVQFADLLRALGPPRPLPRGGSDGR